LPVSPDECRNRQKTPDCPVHSAQKRDSPYEPGTAGRTAGGDPQKRQIRILPLGFHPRSPQFHQRRNLATKIFVNLPVQNLPEAAAFFTSFGFTFGQRFTDRTATCMIVSDDIFVMLLTWEKFKTVAPKSTEVLLALSLESREAVDATARKAVAAGGRTYKEPEDHGFMYGYGFQDLDGHIWELIHMEPSVGHQA